MSNFKKPYDRTVHRLREIERIIKTIGKIAGAPRVGCPLKSSTAAPRARLRS
jgi:hypothetical protein